jgi:XTP/dITP diphosphohydrolase
MTSSASGLPGQVLLATRNAGKLRELRALFDGLGVAVVDLVAAGVPESAEEDALEAFDTFEENALAKARYYFERTGLPTIADDSGLAVVALGGAPGVRSKRYSGVTGSTAEVERANNAALQRALAGSADPSNRRAKFVCAAAFVDHEGELVARGETHGEIAFEPRGAEGFGYDPYFVSDDLGVTFAEAGIAEKEAVSHRGRAFRALVASLVERGSQAGLVDGPDGAG